MASEPSLEPDLLWLLGHRYAVEVLDALAVAPATRTELRARIGASRRRLAATLRGLAAAGAIRRRGPQGSWDLLPAPATVGYELTDTGVDLVGQLSRFEVWLAICARHRVDADEQDQL
jgi:DNA-binding HxlR family transcriptional regulator